MRSFYDSDHREIIRELARALKPKVYLELGVKLGECLIGVIPYCEAVIGVDISNRLDDDLLNKIKFYNMTTVDFIEKEAKNFIFDMVFIDANHSFENSMADFVGILPFVKDQGLILLHDTYPINRRAAMSDICADSYKTAIEIKKHEDRFGVESMTLPIWLGLTIVRKRKNHLCWN